MKYIGTTRFSNYFTIILSNSVVSLLIKHIYFFYLNTQKGIVVTELISQYNHRTISTV